MAVQGPIPVEFAQVFPHGAFAAGGFEPVRDFEASKGGRFVQAKDQATGLPLWVVDVIDADPAARVKTARVKIARQRSAGAARRRAGDAVRPGGVHRPGGHPVRQPGRAAGLLAEGDRGPCRPAAGAAATGQESGGMSDRAAARSRQRRRCTWAPTGCAGVGLPGHGRTILVPVRRPAPGAARRCAVSIGPHR